MGCVNAYPTRKTWKHCISMYKYAHILRKRCKKAVVWYAAVNKRATVQSCLYLQEVHFNSYDSFFGGTGV
jgi:hypothetical protein